MASIEVESMLWKSSSLAFASLPPAPTQTPRLKIKVQINGNVQGLPTAVPMTAAIMLARISPAHNPANTICKPTKGVNETAAPQANPAAVE